MPGFDPCLVNPVAASTDLVTDHSLWVVLMVVQHHSQSFSVPGNFLSPSTKGY